MNPSSSVRKWLPLCSSLSCDSFLSLTFCDSRPEGGIDSLWSSKLLADLDISQFPKMSRFVAHVMIFYHLPPFHLLVSYSPLGSLLHILKILAHGPLLLFPTQLQSLSLVILILIWTILPGHWLLNSLALCLSIVLSPTLPQPPTLMVIIQIFSFLKIFLLYNLGFSYSIFHPSALSLSSCNNLSTSQDLLCIDPSDF